MGGGEDARHFQQFKKGLWMKFAGWLQSALNSHQPLGQPAS